MVINFAFILILPSTLRWRRNSFSVKFPRNWWIERTPVHPPGIKSGRCNYSADGDWEWKSWPFIFHFVTCNENTKTKTGKVFLTGFLLLRAVWKVLPLSQQISSTRGFLKWRKIHCNIFGPLYFHCGNSPSLFVYCLLPVGTVSCKSQLKLLGVFIHRAQILLTVFCRGTVPAAAAPEEKESVLSLYLTPTLFYSNAALLFSYYLLSEQILSLKHMPDLLLFGWFFWGLFFLGFVVVVGVFFARFYLCMWI